ncbi:MAG: hypothetical protein ACKVOA_03810, partial [Methylophilaceae bacterium]
LNTETKDYSFKGLNIVCAKVAIGENRRLTWSECLERALDYIQTPYILYLQEDYFLEASVRVEALESMLSELREGRADVVRLSEAIDAGPWGKVDDALIWQVSKKAKYQLSLQAALWCKGFLLQQVRAHESPWQFESFGSMRLRRQKNNKIFCINRDLYSGENKEIFPYTPTGVIAGKWVRNIVEPLFAKHKIAVDFSQRGFYHASKRKKRRGFILRLLDRIKSVY